MQHLTDEGKRKIIDLCDATVQCYIRDGAPWMYIQVQLTLQAKEIPIVSQCCVGFNITAQSQPQAARRRKRVLRWDRYAT